MGNSTLSRLCKVEKRVQPLADLRELASAESVEFFTLVYSNQNLQSLKGYLVISILRKHLLATKEQYRSDSLQSRILPSEGES